MFFRTSLFSLAFSVLLFVFIVELIRRRKLQERYSLMWLGIALAMIVFSISRRLLEYVAQAVGIFYPPAALFLLGLLFVIALLLHYSTVISKLADENRTLAQKLAILENKLDRRG